MKVLRLLLLPLLLGVSFMLSAVAQNDATRPAQQQARRLKIAVFDRPPYAIKDPDGVWSGLSIELWEQIAGKLGISYDFVEVPLYEVYHQLQNGACDLSPVIAISGEKAEVVEFTEPYLFSHGAVVTHSKTLLDSLAAFDSSLWNKEVMLILACMLLGMAFFSLLLVLVERKHERGHFGGSSWKGFGSALWFSAVTMTTVGYGDKTPLSGTGRIITFFWMLVGVLLIALFTGAIASSITTNHLQNSITRFEDLARFRVGCVKESRMDYLLTSRGIPATRYETPEGGFEGFSKHEINAYAGDSITLDYLLNHASLSGFKISIVPDAAMIYAFATRPGLPELASINKELLQITLAPDWRAKAEKWTGPLSF